jgi:predicted ATPase
MAAGTEPTRTKARALRLTRVRLQNWRNFREAEVSLGARAFIVGPNASGKSNFLDALRFLRDVAKPEGGLAAALAQPGRGGFKGVRCLFARKPSELVLDVAVGDDETPDLWSYRLVLQQHTRVRGAPVTVENEIVRHRGSPVAEAGRPKDSTDWLLHSQTMLQQVQQSQPFRELADFLTSIRYLHVVPQVVRDARRGLIGGEDPFGGDLLRRMKDTPKKRREPRLRRIGEALALAVPQFEGLTLDDDSDGRPHLYASFRHWRAHPSQHTEEVLSDGTLRLLGFLWSITESGGPLLLEEPELSLHDAVVAQLPAMIARAQRLSGRQVIASTHSQVMLDAPGVRTSEVHRVEVAESGSSIETAAANPVIRAQVERAGWTLGQAVLPLTQPATVGSLSSLVIGTD